MNLPASIALAAVLAACSGGSAPDPGRRAGAAEVPAGAGLRSIPMDGLWRVKSNVGIGLVPSTMEIGGGAVIAVNGESVRRQDLTGDVTAYFNVATGSVVLFHVARRTLSGTTSFSMAWGARATSDVEIVGECVVQSGDTFTGQPIRETREAGVLMR